MTASFLHIISLIYIEIHDQKVHPVCAFMYIVIYMNIEYSLSLQTVLSPAPIDEWNP
jgi:hypothetical protein